MGLPRTAFLISLAATSACAPPPPAPQGLDDASSYLVREFYSSDAKFQAGLQGFVDWFELGNPDAEPEPEPPGSEILGLKPGQEGKETDAFTVGELTKEDVGYLPLVDMVLEKVVDGEEVRIKRDISLAQGVVSLAEMACDFDRAESLLVRRDQDNVFALDWDSYERTYAPSDANRTAYEQAMKDKVFDPIPEDLVPFADDGSFAADFDPNEYKGTLLFTDNVVDPVALVLGLGDLTAYDLNLDLRHGIYDLEITNEDSGERELVSQRAFAILTYNLDAAYAGEDYSTGLRQSFSIEIVLERPNGKSLRMLAVWAEPISGIPLSDGIKLNTAVDKSLKSSQRLTQICEGEVEIEPEAK